MAITIEAHPFGVTRAGEPVTCYRLASQTLQADILDYGVTIQSLRVKDRDGQWRDVALGYDTLEEYETQDGYLGACVGRVCNRIGGAAFTLSGKRWPLARNDGRNHLHGGRRGFDKFVWRAEAGADFVRFARTSPDGEEGYPGTLHVTLTCRVAEGMLELCYDAASEQDTLCSLTNHTYWNLNGGGSVLEHTLRVNAEAFLENDDECLPTGQLLAVDGTPMDFRAAKPLGRDMGQDNVQLQRCGGYDHTFCLPAAPRLHEAAELYSAQSGIALRVLTTLPGVQVYSANGLHARRGKGGAVYHERDAVCLETQFYPNAMRCPGFVKPILHAGERYHHITQYQFSTPAATEEE